MNDSEYANVLTIPRELFNKIDENNCPYSSDELKIITEIIVEQKYKIKRGDLIQLECAGDSKTGEYSHNDGMLIYDGKKVENLYYDSDYCMLPRTYLIYEEPDYFSCYHWYGPICGNYTYGPVWIDKKYNLAEHMEFIEIIDRNVHESGRLGEKMLICYTHYIDCRGVKRYILFDEVQLLPTDRNKLLVRVHAREMRDIEHVETCDPWRGRECKCVKVNFAYNEPGCLREYFDEIIELLKIDPDHMVMMGFSFTLMEKYALDGYTTHPRFDKNYSF